MYKLKYREYYDNILVRIDRGEDVVEKLLELVEKLQLKNGSISGIGASDNITVGLYSVDKKEYAKKTFTGEMEITSILGNISTMNDKPYVHMHIAFAGDDLVVHGGHLNQAIISGTCEIIINKIDEKVDRFRDEVTGINIYDI